MRYRPDAKLDASQVVDARALPPAVDPATLNSRINPSVRDGFTRKAAVALLLAQRTADPALKAKLLADARRYTSWQLPAGKTIPGSRRDDPNFPGGQ